MKLKIWVPLCLALTVVGGACQWRDQPAATINGQVITRESLTEEAATLAESPGFGSAYLGADLAGSNGNTMAIDALRQLLAVRIRDVVVSDELTARKIALSADDLASAEQAIDVANPSFAEVADAERSTVIRRQAVERRFRQVLEARGALKGFPADAESFYEANKANYVEVCLNGIVLDPTQTAEAADALGQLNGGRTFAEVAPKFDPDAVQTGGNLGCGPLATLTPDIRDQLTAAPLDKVVGPLRTPSSLVLVAVYKRTAQPYSAVAPDVDSDWAAAKQAKVQEAFAAWLEQTDLKVKVDPQFGYLTPTLTLSSEPVKGP